MGGAERVLEGGGYEVALERRLRPFVAAHESRQL